MSAAFNSAVEVFEGAAKTLGEQACRIQRLERDNAALLAACKATSDWLIDGFFDPSELSEDAKQILETVRTAIADAETP